MPDDPVRLEYGFAGANKVRFEGRLTRRRKLKPGRYVLTVSVAESTRSSSVAFTHRPLTVHYDTRIPRRACGKRSLRHTRRSSSS